MALSTGDLELIDLGTEYAVRVGRDGAGEVHVLSGKVDVRKAGGGSLRVVETLVRPSASRPRASFSVRPQAATSSWGSSG